MTNGNTLIVDVVSSGDGYMLNDTPVNMMIAYEVVRRHVTDNGTFYSQMTKKHKTAEGYIFKFDTGDTFTCASDTTYPTSATLNDAKPAELPAITAADDGKVLTANSGVWVAQTPASGGGCLVVKFEYANGTSTCDHTFAEIHAAVTAGNPVIGCVADCDGVYRDFAYNDRGDKPKYYLRNGNLYNSSGLKTVKAEIDEDNAVTVTVQEVAI